MSNKRTIVINLFGSPSAGKSTAAAYIFSKLKVNGINAELVTEYVKEKVWENNKQPFEPDNQCYLFGKQFYRLNNCVGKVDVIVTDSPLLLNSLYNKSEILGETFNQVVLNCFNSFNNINYFVNRNFPYQEVGRVHTESESEILNQQLVGLLNDNQVKYSTINADITEYDLIIKEIIEKIKKV